VDPQYLAQLQQRLAAGQPLTDGERAILLQAQMQQRQQPRGILDLFDSRQPAKPQGGYQAVAAVRG